MPLRILLLGKTRSRTGFSRFLAEGFRELGHRATFVNPRRLRWLPERIALELLRVRAGAPDLVVSYHADVPVAWLSAFRRTSKVLQYYEDYDWTLKDEIVERGRLADLFVLTNSGQLDEYRARGVRNPVFLPGACWLPAYEGPVPASGPYVSDIAFIGAAKGKERERSRVPLVRRLAAEFDLGLWGRTWEEHGLAARGPSVGPFEFGQVCRGAKIVLGADHTGPGGAPPVRHYMSDRTWHVLGSGGLLLARYVDGLEDLVENGRHLVFWRDDDECIALAREWLRPERDEERRRIARAGFELVKERRTTAHLAREMLGVAGLGAEGTARPAGVLALAPPRGARDGAEAAAPSPPVPRPGPHTAEMRGRPAGAAPRVTIGIPVFRGKPYLAEAIEAALAQTYEDREIIVLDDASPDGTFELACRYEERGVQVFRNERNLGQAANVNLLIDLARGEFVCITHHDDRLRPAHIERSLAAFERAPGAAFAHTNFATIDVAGSVVGGHMDRDHAASPDFVGAGPDYAARLIVVGNPVCFSSVLARRSAYRAVGGFDSTYRYALDFDMWLRMLDRFDAAYVGEVLLDYRVHASQVTAREANVVKYAERVRAKLDALGRFERSGRLSPGDRRRCRAALARECLRIARRFARQEPELARRLLSAAFGLRKLSVVSTEAAAALLRIATARE